MERITAKAQEVLDMSEPFPYMVICDFDGTITTEDTFYGLVNHLFSKEHVEATFKPVLEGKITLIDACTQIIESIPTSDLYRIDEYIGMMQVRPGFDDFLRYLKEIDVPLVVLSGGLDYTVKGRLAPYRDLIHAIYSAVLDTSGKYLSVLSPCTEPYSFLDKSSVLARLKADVFIGIGDGFTDLTIAGKCDHMFARDQLYSHMTENHLKCIPWENFFDVIDHMQKHIIR
jgi:2-hydroxy-3-keto-5-methylthiopentenyl-1-phosphate phosphatase